MAVRIGVRPNEPVVVEPFDIESDPTVGIGGIFLFYGFGILLYPVVEGIVHQSHLEVFGFLAEQKFTVFHTPQTMTKV